MQFHRLKCRYRTLAKWRIIKQHSSTNCIFTQPPLHVSSFHVGHQLAVIYLNALYTTCSSPACDLVSNLYVLSFQYLNYSTPNAGLCEKPKHVDEFLKYISCTGMLLLLVKYKPQRDEQHKDKMNWVLCTYMCVCVCIQGVTGGTDQTSGVCSLC